jgi:large subunit ribosomal protein L21
MYAIVDIHGKQYRLEEGRYLDVDCLPEAPESTLTFDRVLLVGDENRAVVGAPVVAGATVEAKVLSHGRKAKLLVYKMRCKKGYRRKNGHRQGYTRIQVLAIKEA